VFWLFRKLRKIFMGNVTELKYTKIRGVKSPTRANPTDAGLDIYVPYDLTRVDMNKMIEMTKCNIRVDVSTQTGCVTNLVVAGGEQVLVPTGLKIAVPKGYYLKVADRSSVAVRKGLHVTAGIIDSGYEGEILVSMVNVTNKDSAAHKLAVLCPGDAFAQLILCPIETPEPVEVPTAVELFKSLESDRKEGGFGSTDGIKG
jgi:dUTP pyrophosphatase